jgi:hypothetical protein
MLNHSVAQYCSSPIKKGYHDLRAGRLAGLAGQKGLAIIAESVGVRSAQDEIVLSITISHRWTTTRRAIRCAWKLVVVVVFGCLDLEPTGQLADRVNHHRCASPCLHPSPVSLGCRFFSDSSDHDVAPHFLRLVEYLHFNIRLREMMSKHWAKKSLPRAAATLQRLLTGLSEL